MTTKDKTHSIAFTMLAAGLFAAESHGAVVSIDFNDGAGAGLDIGGFYSGSGVTFSNGEWAILGGFTPAPGSTGFMVVGDGGDLQPTAADPIVFTFSSPMSAVSIIANSVNANGARIDLYNAESGGTLVDFDQVVGPSGSLNSNFVLSASGPGIRRVELYQPFSVESEGVLFDNLEFDSVPEPSGAIFLTLSSLGFLVRRRRV